jgi:hypothetical protein
MTMLSTVWTGFHRIAADSCVHAEERVEAQYGVVVEQLKSKDESREASNEHNTERNAHIGNEKGPSIASAERQIPACGFVSSSPGSCRIDIHTSPLGNTAHNSVKKEFDTCEGRRYCDARSSQTVWMPDWRNKFHLGGVVRIRWRKRELAVEDTAFTEFTGLRISGLRISRKTNKHLHYYKVSGGPVMQMFHTNTLLSSARPALKYWGGFFDNSEARTNLIVSQVSKIFYTHLIFAALASKCFELMRPWVYKRNSICGHFPRMSAYIHLKSIEISGLLEPALTATWLPLPPPAHQVSNATIKCNLTKLQ